MIDDSNNLLRASQSGDKAVDEELYIDKIEALTIAASGEDYFMEHLVRTARQHQRAFSVDWIDWLVLEIACTHTRLFRKRNFSRTQGKYISYICNAAARHHVMLNPSFISAALAVKVQEGIALSLDPSIQIYKVATPIIVESERRRHMASLRHRVKKFFLQGGGVDEDDKKKEMAV